MGSAFNTRGLQNIGLAFALEPGLQRIYSGDFKGLQKARRRHLKLYNAHPFWNPLLVGLFLSLEGKIARQLFPASTLTNVKTTLVYTLSAIGDSFFSGSLLVSWSLATVLLLASGQTGLAIALGAGSFLALQLFKAYLFYQGYMRGLSFVDRLKRWDLINWGGRLKILNSLLVLGVWLVIWPFQWHVLNFVVVCLLALGLTWTYHRFQWSKELLLIGIFLCTFLISWEHIDFSHLF